MTTTQLYYFISVAETLNFTQAAKEHYVAQTAVSQQIAALENELDVTLFIRTTRSVALTEAGRSLYCDARKIIADLEHASYKAWQYDRGTRGFLSLGYPGKHGMKLLTPLLKSFRQACPDVRLMLESENNYILQQYLRRGRLDMTFTFTKNVDEFLGDPRAIWIDMDVYPLCIVISTDHPLAGKTSVTWDEVNNELLLSGPEAGAYVQSVSRSAAQTVAAADADTVGRRDAPQRTFRERQVSTDDTLLTLIESGYGCGVLPSFMRSKYEDAPRFIKIEGEENGPHLMLGWLRENANPSVSQFIDVFSTVYADVNPRFDARQLDALRAGRE